MLGILINKELRAIITSPKFTATFAVCSLLLLISVYTGIIEYKQMVRQYDAAEQLITQNLQSSTSYRGLASNVYRKPDPMQIFVSGLNYDIGRFSHIDEVDGIKLQNSAYSDDPILAVFRYIDFTFIVTIVFSLFAILFTYDAVSGECEQGTLRLVLANSVPRARYLIAKSIGSWLGLAVPLIIPILLSMLLLQIFGIPFSGQHWVKLFLLTGLSFLLVTFFIFIGVFVSTLTRRSSVSFLLSLVCWIALVLIIPRAAVVAAGQIINVPRLAEIEGQRDGYAKDRWDAFWKESEKRWAEQDENGDFDPHDEDAMWRRMQIEDSLRREVDQEIAAYDRKLMEDLRVRKQAQQQLAFILARFSPVAAYQLGAMTLAASDIGMKNRYEDQMNTYRNDFLDWSDNKAKESGDVGGMMISISSEDGISFGESRKNDALELDEMPKFAYSGASLAESVAPVITDFGLLLVFSLLAFAVAFVRFLKYDAR